MKRNHKGYWDDYKHCYTEAQKYKTRNEFKHSNGSAYASARRNNWLDDYNWFENGIKLASLSRIKWNYDACYKEAKKYKTRNEFKHSNPRAYICSIKNKWIDDYDWFEQITKPKNFWNYENCYNEAKKYKSKCEFKYNCNRGYRVACKNKWLDDYDWFKDGHKLFAKKITKWTYEKCLIESKKYNSRIEFCKGSSGAYTRALNDNWLDDFTWLKNENILSDQVDSVYGYFFEDRSVYIGRTLMRCQKKRDIAHIFDSTDAVHIYAKEHNFLVPKMTILEDNLTIEEGIKKESYWLNYYKEHNYNILNRCKTGSIGSLGRGIWNKRKCYEEAKKYKTRIEFLSNNKAAYKAAYTNGWLKDYIWFGNMRKPKGYWDNYEHCYTEAKKYKSRSEFSKGCGCAYKMASKNNWLDEWFH